MSCRKENIRIIILSLIAAAFAATSVYASDSIITVYCEKEIGTVNKKIFGNNFKSRDPYLNRRVYAISDYGSGVWDPGNNTPVKEIMDLAREAGISVVRYATSNKWNWHNAVGRERRHFLFGLDEFLKMTEDLGAEAVITVSPTIGDEKAAADLVEYLNTPNDGSNPNDGIAWAEQRAQNGHPEAYDVKYFEIGNETYSRISGITNGVQYTDKYLKRYASMKAVDPSIKIGFVLPPALWHPWFKSEKVLSRVREKLDFAVLHRYMNSIWYKGDINQVSPGDRYKVILGMPLLLTDIEIPEYLQRIREKSGKNIPIAVTEYNSYHSGNQHRQLGSALVIAELLKIFMKPVNNILMANHWQMANGLYGMVRAEGSFMNHEYPEPIKYIKRPGYFVYEMYNGKFGDILVDNDVQVGTYDIGKYSFYDELVYRYGIDKYSSSPETKIPLLSVNTSKNRNGDKVYLMVINKDMKESVKAVIKLKEFTPSSSADAWVLNAGSVTDDNETQADNVKLRRRSIDIGGKMFEYEFEPHSLTAIEIRRVNIQ